MSFEAIQKALDGTIKEASLGGLPVALENSGYVPDMGTPFISTNLLPAPTSQAELGPVGADLHEGIYQVSIHYPSHTGTGDINRKADEVATLFKPNTQLLYGTVCITINSVSQEPLNIRAGWAILIVSLDWSTYIPRIP